MTRTLRPLTAWIAVASVVVASGCGAGSASSGSDWEQRKGSDWSEYESAFQASWRKGCERAGEIGQGLEKTAERPVCDPAQSPDDPPDVPPLNPDAAGRIDGFVAGLVWGCGVLRDPAHNECIARGGER